jgi:calnexin
MIDNPHYKGEWKARQLPNENYFEDHHPHNFFPMVSFVVPTMNEKFL